MKRLLIKTCLACFTSLSAGEEFFFDTDPFFYECKQENSIFTEEINFKLYAPQNEPYSYNPYVPLEIWQNLEPFFLPLNHPIKAKLDRIFKAKRITQNTETFEKVFGKFKQRYPTSIKVGRHPALNGYLIKAYLDTQPVVADWVNWLDRIQGAAAVRDCIKRHGFNRYKVPQKWIYPLPLHPDLPQDGVTYHRKNFILVVEDMRLLSSKDNLDAYRKKITPQILDELYLITTEEGMLDSLFPDNISFTKEGYLAFIDTEHYHRWPVNYRRLSNRLSSKMREYWLQLLIERGH